MPDQFELPVNYLGQLYFFNATLNVYGYTHKFQVDVNGQSLIFEPDEEEKYRAVIKYEEINNYRSINNDLIQKIAEAIEAIVK